MKRSRALLALLPIALVGALLTSCSSSDDAGGAGDTNSVDCAPEGDASKSVKIEGDFGASVTLASETPVSADALQRTVLIEGDGAEIKAGDTTDAMLTIINGVTGEVLESQRNSFAVDELLPWAVDTITCSTQGDRVVAVTPVLEVFDAGQAVNFGMQDSDSFVMVFDFLKPCEAVLPRDENYPEFDLGDGATEPKITIPACMEAPTELEVEVLVEGDGPVVEENQDIMTNYVGVKWDGAERFDGNWSETGVQFSTAPGALIAGFTEAMVGQKVGSTILVTIPPELGYGNSPGHALENETLTFVLQLVSVA